MCFSVRLVFRSTFPSGPPSPHGGIFLSSSIHSPCIVLRPGVFPVLSPSMGKACSCWTPVIGSVVGMWLKSGQSEPRRFNSRIFVWAVSDSLGFRLESWGSCRQFIITKKGCWRMEPTQEQNPEEQARGTQRYHWTPEPKHPWSQTASGLLSKPEHVPLCSLVLNVSATCKEPRYRHF